MGERDTAHHPNIPSVNLGLVVSCGRDNLLNQAAKFTLSVKFIDMEKPHVMEIDLEVGDSTDDVAQRIIGAVSKAQNDGHIPKHYTNIPHALSTTVGTGPKAREGGSATGTTSIYVDMLFAYCDSVDVSCTTKKVRCFHVQYGTDCGAKLIPAPGTKTRIFEINCTKLREKLQKDIEDARRKRKDEPDIRSCEAGRFCDWRRDRRELNQLGGMPPIGEMFVGDETVTDRGLIGIGGFGSSGWTRVPFREIGWSLELQIMEMHWRLNSAGIIAEDRSDGVIAPRHFVSGVSEGQRVGAFGILTPYDPLGYGPMPWIMIIGSASGVAAHAGTAVAMDGSVRSRVPDVVPATSLFDAWIEERSKVGERFVRPDHGGGY